MWNDQIKNCITGNGNVPVLKHQSMKMHFERKGRLHSFSTSALEGSVCSISCSGCIILV